MTVLAITGCIVSAAMLVAGIRHLQRRRDATIAELPPSRAPVLDHIDPERIRRARSLS